jgi:hypothetical protein
MLRKLDELAKLASALKTRRNWTRSLARNCAATPPNWPAKLSRADSCCVRRQQAASRRAGAPTESSAVGMSALPLIEAVQRAGGAITLRGDRLRLSAPAPLPENLLQELRAHKAEVIDHLQHARQPEFGKPGTDALTHATISSVEVASWVTGVARLATMAPPRSYPAHAWRQLILDAERFLDDWAQQAAGLGWPSWELFGCHRRSPWGRIDGMGLVLLLHGDQLAALTASEAVIRRASGAHQTWRRKAADPLPAPERCLVWELA